MRSALGMSFQVESSMESTWRKPSQVGDRAQTAPAPFLFRGGVESAGKVFIEFQEGLLWQMVFAEIKSNLYSN